MYFIDSFSIIFSTNQYSSQNIVFISFQKQFQFQVHINITPYYKNSSLKMFYLSDHKQKQPLAPLSFCMKTNMIELVEAKDSKQCHSYKMIPQNRKSMSRYDQSFEQKNLYHLKIRRIDYQKYEIRLIEETSSNKQSQIIFLKNILEPNFNITQSKNTVQKPFNDEDQQDIIFTQQQGIEKKKQIQLKNDNQYKKEQPYIQSSGRIKKYQNQINPLLKFNYRQKSYYHTQIIDLSIKIRPIQEHLQSLKYQRQNHSFQQNFQLLNSYINQIQGLELNISINSNNQEQSDNQQENCINDTHPLKKIIAQLGDDFDPDGVMINYKIQMVGIKYQKQSLKNLFNHQQIQCYDPLLYRSSSNRQKIHYYNQMTKIDDQNKQQYPAVVNSSSCKQDSNNQGLFYHQFKNMNQSYLQIENNNDMNLPKVSITIFQQWDLLKSQWQIVKKNQKILVSLKGNISEEAISIRVQSNNSILIDITIKGNSSNEEYKQHLLLCNQDQFYQYQQINFLLNQKIIQANLIHLIIDVIANTINRQPQQKYIIQNK